MKNILFSSRCLIVCMLIISGNLFGQGVKRAMLNINTYQITKVSKDKTYGYTEKNPIKVGGAKFSEGPENERRFLNALLGPNGEEIEYERLGSCCIFDTPNAPYGGKGLLDKYKITYNGLKSPIVLYVNMYDDEELSIPMGFTAKTSISTTIQTSPEKFKLPGGHIIESEGLVGFWRQFVPCKGDQDLTECVKTMNFKIINSDKSIFAFVNWPVKRRMTPEGDVTIEKDVTDISFYGTYTVDSDSTYTEYVVSHALNPIMNGTKSMMKYWMLNKNTMKVAYKNEAIGTWNYEYWRRVLPAN